MFDDIDKYCDNYEDKNEDLQWANKNNIRIILS